jgi:hypothetical protein
MLTMCHNRTTVTQYVNTTIFQILGCDKICLDQKQYSEKQPR